MDKVYLLLRNNKQTGPYNLEELLRLGLKPTDLIWVEGKSCGWSYPSELEELKLHATAKKATIKNAEQSHTASVLSSLPTTTNFHQRVAPISTPYKHVCVVMPVVTAQQPTTVQLSSPAEDMDKKAE